MKQSKRTKTKTTRFAPHRRIHHVAKRSAARVKKRIDPQIVRAKAWYRARHLLQKIGIWICLVVFVVISSMYGIAQWYIYLNGNRAVDVSVTFIPRYASYLGTDPKQSLSAILEELQVKHVRLVSYWDDYEKQPGQYDFTELDWQFAMAEKHEVKVSLAIGLRQPRWPECHIPDWAAALPKDQWSIHLKAYMQKVIERYKDSPVLESYQLENEFFMKVFGICPDHSRERLVDEYEFVKRLDSTKPVIVSRSNNAGGLPLYAPRPDMSAVSIYKRVWDKNVTKRYFEYPFPAWFYAFLAGATKLVIGRDVIIHELQAEPWLPEGYDIRTASTEELYKSLNPERLRDRFEYGRATGMPQMYLWGAEWWYARKVVHNDPSLWEVAKQETARLSKSPNNCSFAYRNDEKRPPC